MVITQTAPEQFRIPDDPHQNVVEVVGNAAGQGAQRVQSLHLLEPALALGKPPLCLDPSADVHDGPDHEQAVARLDRIETNFHGDEGAVLAAATQKAPASHRARLDVAEVVGARLLMSSSERLGNQDLDGLAHELTGPVPEQLLELSAHQDYRASSVHHD